MATTLHRLQISLPGWQVQYLSDCAKKDRVSMAEVIRRLIQRASEKSRQEDSVESIWEIAGIVRDEGPIYGGLPVSERPEMYSPDYAAPGAAPPLRGKKE